MDRNCARFLKDVFLKDEGSFLVFTSHRVSFVSDLNEYMQGSEESSHCGIMLRELPLVPSLGEAETLKQGIHAMETLFFDLVPALMVQDEKRIPPSVTVRRVTAKWVREGKVDDDERMRDVLNTFLTGRGELKGSPLLQFMSAFSDLRQERYLIRWIPSLMSVALEEIAENQESSCTFRSLLGTIAEQFSNMRTSKVQSGGRLESLVLIVLLIRCLTGKFCNLFSPGEGFEKDCGVLFNQMKAGERIKSEEIKTWEELKMVMCPQTQFPILQCTTHLMRSLRVWMLLLLLGCRKHCGCDCCFLW